MIRFKNVPCLTFLMFLLLTCRFAAADTVTLNNGDEFYGSIIGIDDKTIVIRTDAGDKTVPREDAVKVSFWSTRGIDGEKTVKDIADRELAAMLSNLPGPADEPDAGYVNLLVDVRYTMDDDRKVTKRTRVSRVVLKERARGLGNLSFSYRGDREQGRYLWGRTIVEDTIHDMREDAISDESKYYYLKQYDRLRRRKTALPEVNVGSVFDYCYEIESDSADIEHPFMVETTLRHSDPTRTRRYTVTVPESVPFKYKLFNAPEGMVSVDIRNEETRKKYIFLVKDMPGYREENDMPPSYKIFPWLAFGLDYGWSDVCDRWTDRARELMKPSPDMIETAYSITEKLETPREKARAIYRYVCREIDHHGVSMWAYSYLPRPVSEVFSSKLANSLDKVCLYVSLLSCAGVEADVVLIRSKYSGPVIRSIGSLAQFDTVAARLKDGTWVAPFSDHYLFHELPLSLQGAEGLVVKTGEFITIPYRDPGDEAVVNEVSAHLNTDGSLDVKLHVVYFGDNDSSMRNVRQYREEELRKQMEKMVHGRHPNAKLREFAFKNLDDGEKRVELDLVYSIPGYAILAGEKLMVFKLPELRQTAGWMEDITGFGAPTREYDLWWGWRGRLDDTVTIELPEGWNLRHLPDELSLKGPGLSYSCSLEEKDGAVVVKDRYIREAVEISRQDYDQVKNLLEKRSRFINEWIVVER